MRINSIILLFLFSITALDSCMSQSRANDIVLINVGSYDKGRIAKEITILTALNPKVIAVDVAFPDYSGDTDDTSLYHALQNCKKLVMPSQIIYEGLDYYGKEMIAVVLSCSMEFFPSQAQAGFVSINVNEGDVLIPRQFAVWQKGYTGDIYHHFSICTAMAFDSLKASNFIQMNDQMVDLRYAKRREFKIFSPTEVLAGELSKKDIEGKIVMLGFLGPGNEDKFFTVLNPNENEPDMYGVEYLANIVAQILE